MEYTSFDLAENRIINFPTIGRCIYCGVPEDQLGGHKLTDEHVIPYGLTGNTLIFRAASCVDCQRKIHRPETSVLKTLLGRFREKIDAPTRNRKDRSPTQDLEFRKLDMDGRFVEAPIVLTVSQDEAPASFVSLVLPPPSILEGEAPEGQRVSFWRYVDHDVVDKFMAQIRAETGYRGPLAYKVGDVNEGHLLRFLAKVAHACAVGVFGYDAFEPFLVEGILQEGNDLRKYIGGWEPLGTSGEGEAIQMMVGATDDRDPALVVVYIRLYGMIGAPPFMIAVGKITGAELSVVNGFS